jgi:hypothetical protein
MAQITEVRLVDDLDGGEADESLAFSLDGHDYMIDLSSPNAKRLRESLAPFVDRARKGGRVAAPRKMTQASAPRSSTDKERTQAIRAWATEQGLTVKDRGRIPNPIVAAYDARDTEDGATLVADILVAQGDNPNTQDAPKPTAKPAAGLSDEEIIAWREANGREVKKNAAGKVAASRMKGYREEYDEANGTAA